MVVLHVVSRGIPFCFSTDGLFVVALIHTILAAFVLCRCCVGRVIFFPVVRHISAKITQRNVLVQDTHTHRYYSKRSQSAVFVWMYRRLIILSVLAEVSQITWYPAGGSVSRTCFMEVFCWVFLNDYFFNADIFSVRMLSFVVVL